MSYFCSFKVICYFTYYKEVLMNTFADILIGWYKKNRRDLPWRNITDPYLIWISEIILQQTRVEQGWDYFLRFVERFPNISTLADASEDVVMKYWQGLGYYSRARNLHAAAKSMNGVFPVTYDGVRKLKGVGDYTAAAVCSIAYGMPYAVVDGNVYRVLSRYWGIETPIDSTEGKKLFAALATEMLDVSRPALYNQAIMDFGAMQCTPKAPDCMICPLIEGCSAYREGKITQLPVKQHRTKVTNRYFNYIYVQAGRYTYLHKRTEDDIWKNLFELPLIETDKEVTPDEFAHLPQVGELFAEKDGYELFPICLHIKHVLSHRVIYANFYGVVLPENTMSFASYLRIDADELEAYAVPRLIHAFLDKYQ